MEENKKMMTSNVIEEQKTIEVGGNGLMLNDEVSLSTSSSVLQTDIDYYSSNYPLWDNENYLYMKQAYADLLISENDPLEDDKDYEGILADIKASETFTKKYPSVDFIYKVDNGTLTPKEAIDTYVFYSDNSEYLTNALKKLFRTLQKYNFKLQVNEVWGPQAIVDACYCLIGTKVIIKQKTNDKGYPKYNVISTERSN